MNIQEAKQEIENTLRAYLRKDEGGNYLFPTVRQRPILLMGPPGIGKTAIMEQIAQQLHIGLVSYTMTHHTRQSAIGLPQITQQTYGTETVSVTRYTMSEIIASVYDTMERTSCREGILFLDEINCVSDTLAPTMLQFLQNKTFGTHVLPRGWIIVAAGNPAEYNKSVREFDIVTLDRVRTIEVTPDVEVFLEYGCLQGLHGAVQSYLRLHPEQFYHVSRQENRLFYVTARGWEDLSALLESYEKLGIPVAEEVISEYLCLPETSREFFAYYSLYRKYGSDYCIPEILSGEISGEAYREKCALAAAGDFVERFAVTEMVLHRLRDTCGKFSRMEEETVLLHEALKTYFAQKEDFTEYLAKRREAVQTKQKFSLLTDGELRREETVLSQLEEMALELKKKRLTAPEEIKEHLRSCFEKRLTARNGQVQKVSRMLENGIKWLRDSLGNGQELTALLSGMTASPAIMAFIARHNCPEYLKECGRLQIRLKEETLRKECESTILLR